MLTKDTGEKKQQKQRFMDARKVKIQERRHVSWFHMSQKCHRFTCLSKSLQSLLFVLYTPTESNAELFQGRYQLINICFLSQALNSIPYLQRVCKLVGGKLGTYKYKKDNQVKLCLVNAKETEQVIYATEELREMWQSGKHSQRRELFIPASGVG